MVHRTALITAGWIAVAVLAGTIAVGANLGILNVADSKPIGKLSAVASTPAAAPQVIHKYTGATRSATTQQYIVKKAGTVKIAAGKSTLRLVDVSARRHWKWSLAQTANSRLTVTFKSGSSVYTFLASLSPQGKLLARVDHPVTRVVQSGSASGSGGSGSYTGTTVAYTATPTAAQPAPAPAHSYSDDGGEADD